MADLTAAKPLNQVGQTLAQLDIPVDGAATAWYEGSMVAALSASGLAVKGGTASTGQILGISTQDIDNSAGADSAVSVRVNNGLFWLANTSGNTLTQAHMFGPCYAEDDQTVSNSSGDGPVAGIALQLDTRRGVLVWVNGAQNYPASQATLETELASTANGEGASMIGVEDSAGNFTGADVEAVLAEIMTLLAGVTGATGANLVGFDDSGTNTTAATVADALDEIYVDMTSAYAFIDIPVGANWFEVDGTALAAFADGVSNTPGLAFDNSKSAGIRWNNAAAPDPICTVVPAPWDMDNSADAEIQVMASKSGNTLADAVTWTIGVFNLVDGAAADADADYGGASSAMTGDAAAKTVQTETLTLANANLPDPDAAGGAAFSITMQPTDGLLDTDDVTVHAVRIRYTRKLRTS